MLRRTWRQFTKTIPTEKLLVNFMNNQAPRRVQGTDFVIDVTSESQRNILAPHLNAVTRFLHEQLRNTHITLSINLQQDPNAPRRAYSPREKFKEMQEA
ncbi:MAG: hypothetical protein Q4B58_00505, partial [Bacteroidales bacterium]|nr:hypothetical protein [Bacteroidales bacterium]